MDAHHLSKTLSKLNRIQPNLAKLKTNLTYEQILRGYCIFTIFEWQNNKSEN